MCSFNHSCYFMPSISIIPRPSLSEGALNGAVHPLFYFYHLFLKTFSIIYLSVPVVAGWLLVGDVQLSEGPRCCLWCPPTQLAASVVVTPAETSTEWTPQGTTPNQMKTSNLQSDSFLKKYMQWDSHWFVDSEWATCDLPLSCYTAYMQILLFKRHIIRTTKL